MINKLCVYLCVMGFVILTNIVICAEPFQDDSRWIMIQEREHLVPKLVCDVKLAPGQGWIVRSQIDVIKIASGTPKAEDISIALPQNLAARVFAAVKRDLKGVSIEAITSKYRNGIPSVRVKDGWVAGFDFGEFGGGVYWVKNDGRELRRISRDNYLFSIENEDGVWVFTGLSHLGLAIGHVAMISKENSIENQKVEFINLSGYPIAATRWNGGIVMVLTDNGIREVDSRSGDMLIISFNPELSELHPNSIAVYKHFVYIGMEQYVERVLVGSALEQWWSLGKCE